MSSITTVEKALKETEVEYSGLIENLPVAIYTCDKAGYITSFNKAAVELWGRVPLVGKDLWCGSWKIFYPDGVTPLELDTCPMAVTLREGQAVSGKEIIIERPDGIRKNILPHPQPLFDTNGELKGAVNMLVDITERKAAETQKATLAAIIQSSEDAIISKTLTGIVTSWNPRAEIMFGYTEKEMIGQPITTLIPPDRKDEETHILQRLKKGERVEHFETKRITKQGKILDISLMISPVKDSNGTIIGASKIARDITEQKRINDALLESEERLRMAGEAARLGTWEYHPQTGKMIWSEQCKKIYGFPPELEPDYQFIAAHNHPEDIAYIETEVRKALEPDNKKNFEIQYRIIRSNDKKQRWIKTQGKVIFDNRVPERFIGTMVDITEEKQSLQQMTENEERLRLAIQSTQLGTWEYVPTTGKLAWSEECRKIYDVPDDIEIDYALFHEHIHPDDIHLTETAIQKALDPSGNGEYDIQYRILRYSDKQPRWISTHGKVYFNNNQPDRFIGTVLDITKEKTEEQQLKDSVELFQTMADNVPAMIWMSGNDKFNDYFNRAWLEYRGNTQEEERNEGWLKGVHPDDVQKCIDTYNKALLDQKGFYTEYRLMRHDGQYRWIADNCVPRFSPNNHFAGFISACMDIDDQKRFREKLLDNELLFKTISNASPVGLWMTDANAQNTFVNDTWIKWTGIPLEKQLGTGWLEQVVEEDKPEAPSRFQQALQKREKYSTEFRIHRRDGELRWCLTEGSPYYDINGEFAGYAGSVTDITDLKKIEERKDDFIKMASHELKTPITSIKGYVQLLLNIYGEGNEEKLQASRTTVKSSLETISKQVTKLTRLVSELLDLNRIESGKLELHKIQFDPGILAEETGQDIRQTTTRHAIIVRNEFEGTIYADKDRISQVLLNLLTNAIKYSPEPSQIEIVVTGNKNNVSISVADQGIGIDKKEQSKIFERFYRVEGKSEQTYPGFGIGLFIAQEIVQRHNGTISVSSQKGKGSVFTFTLPVFKK
jgi:PAS domain S-box-containing protein